MSTILVLYLEDYTKKTLIIFTQNAHKLWRIEKCSRLLFLSAFLKTPWKHENKDIFATLISREKWGEKKIA